MHIEYFSFDNMHKIEDFIINYGIKHDYVNESTLKHILKTSNVSMLITNISNIEASLIMGVTGSVSKTSQKFIKVNTKSYSIPNNILGKNHDRFISYMNKFGNIYDKLIEFGVSKDDARYILPTAMNTNIFITISADIIIDIIHKISMYKYLFDNLLEELQNYISPVLYKKIYNVCVVGRPNRTIINNYFDILTKDVIDTNNITPLSNHTNYDDVLMSILCFGSNESPIKLLNELKVSGNTLSLFNDVDILSFPQLLKHSANSYFVKSSIITYITCLSCDTYNVHREGMNLVINGDLDVYIPKSITQSNIYKDILLLIDEYNAFIKKVYNSSYTESQFESSLMLLLNCHTVKYVIYSNAYDDNIIYENILHRDEITNEVQNIINDKLNHSKKINYHIYKNMKNHNSSWHRRTELLDHDIFKNKQNSNNNEKE